MLDGWKKLDNELIYPARLVIGNTSDETLNNLKRIRKHCNETGFWFTLVFFAEELTEMKKRYFEKGNVPGIHKLSTLPDFILYVENGSIRIIKERIKRD